MQKENKIEKMKKNPKKEIEDKSSKNCHCDDLDINKKSNFNGNEDNTDCNCNISSHIDKDNLEDIIKDLKNSNDELKNNLMKINEDLVHDRLKYSADLENFKKRIQREKDLEQKYASLNLIKDILVPFEQLEKVMEMNTDNDILKNFILGFQMIYQQIKKILEKNGVQEILSLGQEFNPEKHYAVEKISDRSKPNNTIVSVLQKGFLYKEMIIKPAMVKINEWSDEDEKKNK
ncbi:nucleotide exchange factor GrpE [Candidatus Phytoplasma sacchari]|uniref:Protein GrpE n=1 Tax=Candidatus Phytoplasma sacchari TaxID=2609813 RepID=A0ABY7M0W7_9MOLU|nr:nucleotide exchange factor GrpE [Candidatus Phytoplasma sacchari]